MRRTEDDDTSLEDNTIETDVKTAVTTTNTITALPTRNESKASLRAKMYACYMCGLFKRGIPINQECYQVFDSPDRRFRHKKKKFRVKCVHHWRDYYWSGRYVYAPFFRGGLLQALSRRRHDLQRTRLPRQSKMAQVWDIRYSTIQKAGQTVE
ncbi:unnamed protein product [Leptosia nina]|uniref:Uncharacterized protein n=1 Tax=Leptosia nina TaxID=320188 RepID=A0AAV1IZ12_9NEOP